MEIRNNNSNMSFQARVPKHVKEYLHGEALGYGAKTLRALRSKISEIESCGNPDNFVDLSYVNNATRTISFDKPFGLVLTNTNARLSDEVVLSAGKKSLFQNFMALTKEDIALAERELNARTLPKNDTPSLDVFG